MKVQSMAASRIHHTFGLALVVFAPFLLLPQTAEGFLSSPTGVTARSQNDTAIFIISWRYNPAPYIMVHLRDYFKTPTSSGMITNSVGPTSSIYCLPDNTTCSFCVRNLQRNGTTCTDVNPGYLAFLGTEQFEYENIVSVKVGACSRNESSSCLNSAWKNYTIPPGAPSAVRDVSASPLTSKTAQIMWTAPSVTRGHIVKYTIYYKTSGGQELSMVNMGNATKVTLDALMANTTYMIWVAASTSAKEGERSNMISVKTHEDECVSKPCQNKGTCEVTGDSFKCTCMGDWKGTVCDTKSGATMLVPRGVLLAVAVLAFILGL